MGIRYSQKSKFQSFRVSKFQISRFQNFRSSKFQSFKSVKFRVNKPQFRISKFRKQRNDISKCQTSKIPDAHSSTFQITKFLSRKYVGESRSGGPETLKSGVHGGPKSSGPGGAEPRKSVGGPSSGGQEPRTSGDGGNYGGARQGRRRK